MMLSSFARRVVFLGASAVAVLMVFSGCGGSGAVGDLDKVTVAISVVDVTVTNTSGRGMMEVRVEIQPVGHQTAYTTRIPKLENGESRSLNFMAFSDKSGIQFSPRSARPHAVVVTAKDIDGKDIMVEVPWKQG